MLLAWAAAEYFPAKYNKRCPLQLGGEKLFVRERIQLTYCMLIAPNWALIIAFLASVNLLLINLEDVCIMVKSQKVYVIVI